LRRREALLRLSIVASLAVFLARLIARWDEFAWDYSANWTAGLAVRLAVPLYDRAALKRLALSAIGPQMEGMFDQTLTSFIGSPLTALLHVPLTLLPFQSSLLLHRAAIVLLSILSVWIASRALPRESQLLGLALGLAALCWLPPFMVSTILGQVDHLILLGLALAVWGTYRRRPGLAGVGIALASALKVSPGLLLAHGLVRRRWRTIASGAMVGLGVAALTLIALPASSWWEFASRVLPSVSVSTLAVDNQSIPAYLARTLTSEASLLDGAVPLGPFGILSAPLLLLFLQAIWLALRTRSDESLDAYALSLIVLAILLSGPVAWNNYFSWTAIPATQFANRDLWLGRPALETACVGALLLLGTLFLAVPLSMVFFTVAQIEAFGALRWLTGPKTLGALIWLGTGLFVLTTCRARPVDAGAAASS
jgi:hypothetical protein